MDTEPDTGPHSAPHAETDSAPHAGPHSAPHSEPNSELETLLRSLRVWDTELPAFDPEATPEAPLPLFTQWFAAAVAAGQSEPHTPSLATTDAEGHADIRTVMLHGADARSLHFASHAGSAKGRQLAARPFAALGFYWPVQGRQIRLRGTVRTAPAEVAHTDLHARSTGALAAALTGRQSEPLATYEELARASEAAWERAQREPDARVPSWTVYELEPDEVEFFQGDARRRHVRLKYTRHEGGWAKELLWP
ncbi:pyridoxal 5'-phosphate synthase [Streptomyces kunmingensis]|uniref:Pyridoxal 5'-phosphate synthase n=1 Tax=Streptomyces kunmingensis TaxID=68225 RepID=A0ABU6CK46_9ACTN|nr:pyridoxal 5'-phosphate synthase [Streptomyces kunmingensis]MEB3964265.1 pyridoxal 5'-phosphate synthase [Streptomyces kunmingensis]